MAHITVAEAIKQLERDPVTGFVAIAVMSAQPPNKRVIAQLKGRNLVLPDWTRDEWLWYGAIAWLFANNIAGNSRAGISLMQDELKRFSAARDALPQSPTPEQAAAFYDRCVRLVIAADAASDRNVSGPTMGQAVTEAFKEVPQTIGRALAAILGVGGDVLLPVMKEATEILFQLFGDALKAAGKSSVFPIIAIGFLAWLWWDSKRHKGE